MPQDRLAIIVDSAAKPSETFIRDHIRHVAPNQTVLISADNSASNFATAGALTHIGGMSKKRQVSAFMNRLLRLRFYGIYPLPISTSNEDNLIAFLKAQGVTHVFIEYLHVAAQFIHMLKKAGFRVWIHGHGYDLTSLPQIGRLRSTLVRALSLADGVFVPSKNLAQFVLDLGCSKDKIVVSPCGVDPQVFHESTHDSGRLLMVGRLVEKKAPLHSLKALKRVIQTAPHAHLDIVGDGPLRDICLAYVDEARLGEYVTFHGVLGHDKVRDLMCRAEIFIQHSVTAENGDREGLPVALLEAMSAGLPVVSTLHSGIPEAVEDGKSGYLVEEHDIVGFATCITQLLTKSDLSRQMGTQGRNIVEGRFTVSLMAARIRSAMAFTL